MSAKPFMRALLGAAVGIALVPATPAMAQVMKYESSAKSRILDGVEVKAGTTCFSCQANSPHPSTPRKPSWT